MAEAFFHRLARLRADLGLTQGEMAQKMGVPYSTYQRYEQGRTPPKMRPLSDLASKTNTSLDWLVFGIESRNRSGIGQKKDELITHIPRLDVQAAAGAGSLVEAESVIGRLPFPTAWLRRLGAPLNTLQAIEARGDSMAPDLRDGDILLVDTSVDVVARDGLYILRYGDTLRVKELQQRADGGILIRSHAGHVADEIVARDQLGDLAIVGRVRWHGRVI